jgi:NitT/TauT family transport system ATP-binding protein
MSAPSTDSANPSTPADFRNSPDHRRSEKIALRGITHWYRDPRSAKLVHAVESFDLTVADREFISIVGPSGCGKTTLLSMISGLIRPSRGSVVVDGTPVDGLRPGLMGYMFARDSLLPWRKVARNIRLGLEFDKREIDRDRRVQELVATVGLTGFEDHYPDQLSHGMRQRVALARTLAGDPEVLLMDEPFGALDAQTRTLMQEEFVRIWEAHQKTVVFVTHDIDEALALSDRVIVMSARPGRLQAEYVIDFPRPRNIEDLHATPEFQALRRRIWRELRNQVEHGS